MNMVTGDIVTSTVGETATFEPRIVAFLCHYCAFAAADMAGVMRLQQPPNIRVIRLPCTGKLDGRVGRRHVRGLGPSHLRREK